MSPITHYLRYGKLALCRFASWRQKNKGGRKDPSRAGNPRVEKKDDTSARTPGKVFRRVCVEGGRGKKNTYLSKRR